MVEDSAAPNGTPPPSGGEEFTLGEVVNLTELPVWVGWDKRKEIPPSGQVAWVPTHRTDFGHVMAEVLDARGERLWVDVPLTAEATDVDVVVGASAHAPGAGAEARLGATRIRVVGLPAPRDDRWLIVSRVVAVAAGDRTDLLVVGPEVCDERGIAIAYRGFTWWNHPAATAEGVSRLVRNAVWSAGLLRASVDVSAVDSADGTGWNVRIIHAAPKWRVRIVRAGQRHGLFRTTRLRLADRDPVQACEAPVARALAEWGLAGRCTIEHVVPDPRRQG